MSTFESTTKIYKSAYGWQGQTNRSDAGKDWQITTSKRSSGHIVSMAQAVQDEGNGCVSYMLFGNDKERFELYRATGTATEKAIKDAHYRALAVFDAKVQAGELGSAKDAYKIEIGQILFTDGPFEPSRRAVCEILGRGRYKCVLLDGSGFKHDDHVRDFREKFGIGVYYTEGERISESELADLVCDATNAVAKKDLQERAEKAIADAHRLAMIEIGRKVLPELPASLQGLVVGELKQDESDIMTDYFASSTQKVIYLALSTHKRHVFPELKKAAMNCPDTAFLAEYDEFEQRENYSGGHGYYLGKRRHSGWHVRKDCYFGSNILETLQIAIGEGRWFVPSEPEKSVGESPAAQGIEIVEYSEKALAVIGETYPIRQMLKDQGGRFNRFLKIGGQTVAGWIFQKSNPPSFA